MKMFDLGLGGVRRLLVAAAVTAAVAGCVRYDVAIPLDRFRNVAGGAVRGSEITVSAGETWLAEGEYGSFMLKGQAFTSPGAEAALAFHTDGTKGGYEVLFRHRAAAECNRRKMGCCFLHVGILVKFVTLEIVR